MTEPMIPLSVIDARIKILNQKEHLTYINEPIPSWIIVNELEQIKKEAIPSPEFTREQVLKMMDEAEHNFRVAATAQPLEQRIRERINGWDASLYDPNRFKYFKKGEWKPHKERVLFLIDELRKLLK